MRATLAHGLQIPALKGLLLMSVPLLTSCIIPPPFAEEADGGGLHPVRINRALTFPPLNQDLVVQQSTSTALPNTVQFNVALDDPDDQTLYIRVFVNRVAEYPQYKTFVPISPDRIAGKGSRGIIFTISGPCDALVNNQLGMYLLSLWVSDTEFAATGEDLRQNVGLGFRDDVFWSLKCSQAAIAPDGGP